MNFNLHGDHVPSNVSVIDTVSMTEIAQIEQGVMPHGSRLSNDGMLAYSVAMMSAELFELDTMTFQASRRMRLTGNNETTMAVMENDSHAGHDMGGGAAASPTWVQPAPDGKHAYVALQGLNQVLEVDLEAWAPRRRFHTRKGPYNVDVSADGKHLVVTEKTNHSVGFWDLESGTERASLPASARITHGVAITPDSRFAIVTVEEIGGEPGRVEFYNLETWSGRRSSKSGNRPPASPFGRWSSGSGRPGRADRRALPRGTRPEDCGVHPARRRHRARVGGRHGRLRDAGDLAGLG